MNTLFLDIEAAVSSDEEEDFDAGNGSETSNDDPADDASSINDLTDNAPSSFNRDPSDDQGMSGFLKFLQSKYIDSALVHPRSSDRTSQFVYHEEPDLWIDRLKINGPRAGDWSLFEVKCVAGRELELLFDLQTQFNPPELRSAFASRSRGGSVFLETSSLVTTTKLSVFLRLHGATLKGSGEPSFDPHWNRHLPSLLRVRLIPMEDWISLINWIAPPLKSVPKAGELVQIVKGIYRGDVGVVYRPGGFDEFSILLVPRLKTQAKNVKKQLSNEKKRKRVSDRPPQALFSPSLMRSEFGETSVEQHATKTHHFRFRRQIFVHGLLKKVFAASSVSQTNTFLPPAMAKNFQDSGHPFLKNIAFVDTPSWSFETGECVRVADIKVPLTAGTVRTVFSDRCIVKFSDANGNDEGEHVLEKRHLRKTFETGDSVCISFGVLAGVEGLVVGMSTDSPSVEVLHRVPDSEPKVSIVHVNSVTRSTPSPRSFPVTTNAGVYKLPSSFIPWQEMVVCITRGTFKGRHGRIKDVGFSGSASGLRVHVQWEDHSPYISNDRVWFDYDCVMDAATLQRLVEVQKPHLESPFQLKQSYEPAILLKNFLSVLPALVFPKPLTPAGSSTPMQDLGSETPAWNASEDSGPSTSEIQPPEGYVMPYWLEDDRLRDKDIEVVVTHFGDQKRRLVRYNGIALEGRKTSRQPIVPIPLHTIHMVRDPFLVTSWQGLLLVIRGFHTGKYVRRVSYFYDKEKLDSKRIAIVAVVDRIGPIEHLTGEVLELHPDLLAYTTPEDAASRVRADEQMRVIREEYRKRYSNKAPIRYDYDSDTWGSDI